MGEVTLATSKLFDGHCLILTTTLGAHACFRDEETGPDVPKVMLNLAELAFRCGLGPRILLLSATLEFPSHSHQRI